ncbi:MAG: hypothetical protein AAB431_00320, partial [Patescibacteria group bacterium]
MWSEKGGVISFAVVSDGTTGEEWIQRLEGKGDRVSDYAKSVLRSKDFQPTTGVTTEVRILKGEIFTDDGRITNKIRVEAAGRELVKPNAEVGCLVRYMFSDPDIEAMGLWWIVVMHDSIEDSGCHPLLLTAARGDAGRWLCTFNGHPGFKWGRCR